MCQVLFVFLPWPKNDNKDLLSPRAKEICWTLDFCDDRSQVKKAVFGKSQSPSENPMIYLKKRGHISKLDPEKVENQDDEKNQILKAAMSFEPAAPIYYPSINFSDSNLTLEIIKNGKRSLLIQKQDPERTFVSTFLENMHIKTRTLLKVRDSDLIC